MSDVGRLAVELGRAPARAVPALAATLRIGAEAIRNDLQSQARGHRRFRAFPASITADVRGLDAEIGPDKNRRQGALGNILYFGTAKTGPVLEHPAEALHRALPAIEASAANDLAAAIGGGR